VLNLLGRGGRVRIYPGLAGAGIDRPRSVVTVARKAVRIPRNRLTRGRAMGNRRGKSGVGMKLLKGTGVAVAGGSLILHAVQAADINDLKRRLEAERADKAALLLDVARHVADLKKARADLKRLEGERNREKAASRQAKVLMEKAQAEATRLNAESATLRRESEAKTKEIEILRAKLEEQKKAA
jgi:hypothetical protein